MIKIMFIDDYDMEEINTMHTWPAVPRVNEHVVIHDKEGNLRKGEVKEIWWRTEGVKVVIRDVRPEIKEP